MTWLPWRKRLAQAEEAVHEAERLRDEAEVQHSRVEAIAPRVEELSARLRQLHTDNHFGPMIDQILRGSE